MTATPRPVRIAIDPLLMQRFGPEICWAWRFLLMGMGVPWHEVALGEACDIAYVSDLARGRRAWLCLRGELLRWEHRHDVRLHRLSRGGPWRFPIYDGEAEPPSLPPCSPANGTVVCPRDIIFDAFWLATGQEEQGWVKNRHGHYDLRGTAFHREQVLRLAVASGLGCWLEEALGHLGFSERVPRWPGGKKASACLTHDVDYPGAVRWLEPLRVLRRQGLSGWRAAIAVLTGARRHWHFSSWVDMEKRFGVRSAFYFVPRQGSVLRYALGTPDPFYDIRAEKFRQLFRFLAAEGCEIGMHASYRASESRERLASEKRLLEDVSGQPIVGNRHHYWHLDPSDPEATLSLHERVNLRYDMSLGHDRYVGWRRGTTWPLFPFHQRERRELRTLQVATAWMDGQLFRSPDHPPGERLEILQDLAALLQQGPAGLLGLPEDGRHLGGLLGAQRHCLGETKEIQRLHLSTGSFNLPDEALRE